MSKKILLTIITHCLATIVTFGQNLNLDEYDIFIRDTLICKSDYLKNGITLDSSRLKYLSFKPISDGQKQIYYLSGALYGQGEIKNKKENGFWTYWYENGQKAREGNFIYGKRTGTHSYWYPSGKLRGIGNFSNDKYDGKWTIYNEDGSGPVERTYKNGELAKENLNNPDSSNTKNPAEEDLRRLILTESKEGGKLDFFTEIKGHEMEGVQIKPGLISTRIGIALYKWGKANFDLGVKSVEDALQLWTEFKGRKPDSREEAYIKLGFNKGLEK
jgi:hypothetical protein